MLSGVGMVGRVGSPPGGASPGGLAMVYTNVLTPIAGTAYTNEVIATFTAIEGTAPYVFSEVGDNTTIAVVTTGADTCEIRYTGTPIPGTPIAYTAQVTDDDANTAQNTISTTPAVPANALLNQILDPLINIGGEVLESS